MAHNAYEKILTQISQILIETRKDFKEGSNRYVLTSNWEIGKRIADIGDGKNYQEKYGERVIEKLSNDRNNRFGSGYSERNLLYSRKFFQAYKFNQIKFQLSWTHYRALMSVKDLTEREKLEAESVEKNWSHRKLETVILARIRSKTGKNTGNSFELGLLERSKGEFYHYQIGVQKKLKDSARSVRNLDLGFKFFNNALGNIVKDFQEE